MSLLEKITELQSINILSKHEHLVNGIINALDTKILRKGDQLPSINVMVKELGYARKTIVKAYEDLKSRGIVESKQFKGYFILSEDTNLVVKVALLLYAFHSFQETFYNTLRDNLGDNVQLDVFFHHNNLEIFEAIMSNITPKYGMYVIAPIVHPSIPSIIQRIPPEKLLIVDRYIPLGNAYSHITQEFENITYNSLVELLPSIQKYNEFILYFKEHSDYPHGVCKGFQRFIQDYQINGTICKSYVQGNVQKATAHLFINDTHLWELLKDCRELGLEVGKDIGILAHNDNIVKEIISGGITTMSTDFKLMAQKAAHFISSKEKIQTIIPSKLLKRNSL